MTIEQFSILSLSATISPPPGPGRFRFNVTSARGVVAGGWQNFGSGPLPAWSGSSVAYAESEMASYVDPTTKERRNYLAISANTSTGGSDPISAPDLWAQCTVPQAAGLGGSAVVEQQVCCSFPSLVSAVVELERGATTAAVVTVIATRYGVPPLPTIDGDGVPIVGLLTVEDVQSGGINPTPNLSSADRRRLGIGP
jgi:hypothetical protein